MDCVECYLYRADGVSEIPYCHADPTWPAPCEYDDCKEEGSSISDTSEPSEETVIESEETKPTPAPEAEPVIVGPTEEPNVPVTEEDNHD